MAAASSIRLLCWHFIPFAYFRYISAPAHTSFEGDYLGLRQLIVTHDPFPHTISAFPSAPSATSISLFVAVILCTPLLTQGTTNIASIKYTTTTISRTCPQYHGRSGIFLHEVRSSMLLSPACGNRRGRSSLRNQHGLWVRASSSCKYAGTECTSASR